jgi:predicted P-loop ATPase/GTPase
MYLPTIGIAEKRFVITVAPQKLICPQGRTYPRKAVAIIARKIATPSTQIRTRGDRYDP